MKFLEAVVSFSFKTAEDGRLLYFPRGALGRGYIVPSNEEALRLRRQLKCFWAILFGVGLVLTQLITYKFYVPAAILGALFLASAEIWTWYARRRLQPSSERLSVRENVRKAALGYGAWLIWSGAIFMLLMLMSCIYLLIIKPEDWLWWVVAIVLFGLGFAFYVHLILLRRKHRTPAL
jgi:hypothetical protein